MEQGNWVKRMIGSFMVLVAILISGGWICMVKSKIDQLPVPKEIVLPNFKGRILPLREITPGTFTINKPFAEVESWGKDAIMAFAENGSLIIQVWRPDPDTDGVFQYAVKRYPVSWNNNDVFYVGKEVIQKGKTLFVSAKIDKLFVVAASIVVGMIILLFFCGGLGLSFANREAIKRIEIEKQE